MLGVAAVAVMGLSSAVLTGCGGGGNVLGGGPIVNGTFTGTSANLGGGRTGTFQLESRTDNTVSGTLTVVAPADLKGKISAAAVVLPTGIYNFSGTRNGNSFNASGQFNGTPTFNFTISGTLSTTANAGAWTITGSVNGEPFEFTGSVNVTPGGGGGNGSFTVSNNGSNANTGTLSANTAVGQFFNIAGERSLTSIFTQVISATNVRILTATLLKSGALAVNDSVNLANDGAALYTEGAPINKSWTAKAGTVRITAISGSNVTVQLSSVVFEPSPATPGLTNTATGEFTVNGSGTITLAAPPS
jgi:hypothetical protein